MTRALPSDHHRIESYFGDSSVVVTIKKNQMLFKNGESSDLLYCVISGYVALLNPSDTMIVELLPPGSVFGEEVFCDLPRRFSAKALCSGQVAVLDFAGVSSSYDLLDQVSRLTLKQVSARQSRIIDENIALKTKPPLNRLARLILRLAQIQGEKDRITLPWQKKVMADLIGVRKETFSRLLPKLKEHGAEIDESVVIITDYDQLTALADGKSNALTLRKPISRGKR